MNNTDLYSTIFKRKSIRKYKDEPLESNILHQIENHIKELKPLFENIKTEIVILSEKEITVLLPIKSPHYLTIYSENKEGFLPNAGYMLQQMDLFLSQNGIGTCWLGMGLPKKDVSSRNGLEFVITMAIGYPEGPLYREGVSEFNRKPLSEISEVSGIDELLEGARLAPSASNTQPWYFSGSTENIIVNRKLPNIIKAALYGKYNQVDMGIALCHLELSAIHFGKTIRFKKDNKNMIKGYEYIITAELS